MRRRLTRLAEQQTELQNLMDGVLAQGVHPLFLVEEEYRLALLDAEMSFVESFADRITDPHNDWGALWAAFHASRPSPREGQS
jgi:hypothetical protein